MPTVKLVLEYDGTCYAGWQRQPDHPTIQEAIERAIHQVSHATVANWLATLATGTPPAAPR